MKAEFKFDSDQAGRKLKQQATRQYHAAMRRARAAKRRAPYVFFMGLFWACWIVIAVGFLSMALSCAPPPEPTGYGSCYEPEPICLGGTQPVCVCDITNYCAWACL